MGSADASLSRQSEEPVSVPRQPWSRYTLGLMIFVFGIFGAVIFAIVSIYMDHLKRQSYLEQHTGPGLVAPVSPSAPAH